MPFQEKLQYNFTNVIGASISIRVYSKVLFIKPFEGPTNSDISSHMSLQFCKNFNNLVLMCLLCVQIMQ